MKIINPIDTLDFYLNTFDMISSSHPVIVNYVAYGKAIEFRHENILLADSNTNEPASHGFVRYKILPKEKLWTTNYVRNMALIYFDFNEAVVTNTIYTRVVTPTGIEDSSPQINLGVFPNPVTQELIVETMNVGNETLKLELYNLYGKKLKDLYHGKCFKQFKFDVGDLNSGVYFIRYNVNGVTNSVKFVKM
ncbi:MAG: T9SS type A sorting domain-containing protein [Bacteroidetes bacterium]|nr:T9SS type A sorting domain-containing protein [Bacteroidota bacterium]